MSEVILECVGIYKHFDQAGRRLQVLSDVNLTVSAGEKVAIVGPSGSGKTTLLQICGGLDEASSGAVYIGGERIDVKNDRAVSRLRNRKLGFVYQLHYLLPELDALANVAMPMLINGTDRHAACERAAYCLGMLGLKPRLHHRPSQLSGGERQRVAMARAIVNHPLCVLADEPSGNLDEDNSNNVFTLLSDICASEHLAVLLITHDKGLAQRMDRVLELSHGNLNSESSVHPAKQPAVERAGW